MSRRWDDAYTLARTLEFILSVDYFNKDIVIDYRLDCENKDVIIKIYDPSKVLNFDNFVNTYYLVAYIKKPKEDILFTIMNHTIYELSHLLYNKIRDLNPMWIARCNNEK